MASPSTVITLGYGSFGSVNLLPTLGYGSGEALAPVGLVCLHPSDAVVYELACSDAVVYELRGSDAVVWELATSDEGC